MLEAKNMGVARKAQQVVERAVRDELGRILERAVQPIHEKVDEVITAGVRRAVGPIEARLERLVNDAARRTFDCLVDVVVPRRKRR